MMAALAVAVRKGESEGPGRTYRYASRRAPYSYCWVLSLSGYCRKVPVPRRTLVRTAPLAAGSRVPPGFREKGGCSSFLPPPPTL